MYDCPVCHLNVLSVCQRCLAKNIVIFHQRLKAATVSKEKYHSSVSDHLGSRPPLRKELAGRIHNVRREVQYTSGLVLEAQKKLDEIRDKIARRRTALESAKQTLHQRHQRELNHARTQTRTRRKEWKLLYENIIKERQVIVKKLLSLYRFRAADLPSYGSGNHPNRPYYQIGGLEIPKLFCLRDFPPDHVTVVYQMLAHCIYLLARYLGIKLPYQVFLGGPGGPSPYVMNLESNRTLRLILAEDVVVFAEALACITIDAQIVCGSQGVELFAEQCDVGHLVHQLLSSIPLGRRSDATACTTRQDSKDDLHLATWKLAKLASRIAEELSSDAFELIERDHSPSSSSLTNRI